MSNLYKAIVDIKEDYGCYMDTTPRVLIHKDIEVSIIEAENDKVVLENEEGTFKVDASIFQVCFQKVL